MSVYIFIPEDFGRFPVRNEFFRILLADFVKLVFTDFAGGDIVIVPIGIAVPGKILTFSINRSVSASKPDLI